MRASTAFIADWEVDIFAGAEVGCDACKTQGDSFLSTSLARSRSASTSEVWAGFVSSRVPLCTLAVGELGAETMTGLEAEDHSGAAGDTPEELESVAAAAAAVVRAYSSCLGSHFEYGDLEDCGLLLLPVEVVGESEVILADSRRRESTPTVSADRPDWTGRDEVLTLTLDGSLSRSLADGVVVELLLLLLFLLS